jgi:hypothetical protein
VRSDCDDHDTRITARKFLTASSRPRYYGAPFQARSATVQHRRHGGVIGGGRRIKGLSRRADRFSCQILPSPCSAGIFSGLRLRRDRDRGRAHAGCAEQAAEEFIIEQNAGDRRAPICTDDFRRSQNPGNDVATYVTSHRTRARPTPLASARAMAGPARRCARPKSLAATAPPSKSG